MPNQITMSGGQSQKQKARKYAPIWVNRYISGYWPNRNPLRDASLPVLQEKFYGALNDALINGQDCEVNTRSELTRRAGNSIFDSNTFSTIEAFYSYPIFGNNGSSYRRVVAATNSTIYDITNGGNSVIYTRPSNVTLTSMQTLSTSVIVGYTGGTLAPGDSITLNITGYTYSAQFAFNGTTQLISAVSNGTFTFAAIPAFLCSSAITGTGSVPTEPPINNIVFQAIGDVLYFSDGYLPQQVLAYPDSWTANTVFPAGTSIIDSNGNVQVNQGVTVTLTQMTFANTIVTVNYTGATLNVGNNVTLNIATTGLFAEMAYNGTTQIITSVGAGTFTFNSITGLSASSPITGFGTSTNLSGGGETGGTQPTWNTAYNGPTADGSTTWIYGGPAVRNIGIVAPTNPPAVTNTPASPQGNAWAASTYYFPSQVIFDLSTTTIQQLTTAGTTGGSVPTFSTTVGTTTSDGSAVWTCIAHGSSGSTSAVRSTSTTYALNAIVLAAWSKTIITGYTEGSPHTNPRGPTTTNPGTPIYSTISYSAFFECTTPGVTSGAGTSVLAWPLSGTFSDGTAVWTFVGLEVTRATSSSSPHVTGSTFTAGSIGNTTLVSLFGSSLSFNPNSGFINDIVAPGSGAGNLEQISLAGLSGSSHPTWPTGVGSVGVTTVDGTAVWISQGTSGSVANTGYWTYAYAFASSSTPDVSSASPISTPIIEGANSWISITGSGTTQLGVDQIYIYRTLQQATNAAVTGSELFLLAIIPLPAGGIQWNYVDSSPDPPTPGSTLNTFIIADTTGVNTPPSDNITNFVYYLGRLWGSIGNTVYASAGPDVVNTGNPFTAFPPENFIDFPSTVIRMVPSSQGLMVYTANNVQVITGNGIAPIAGESGFTTFVPNVYIDDLSLGNYYGLTTDGGTTYIYTVDNNVVSISSSGMNWISVAISNKLQNSFTLTDGTTVQFTPSTARLTWYINGDDYGLLVSDNVHGWFRMMPSTAPDSGNMVWSPFAEIAGGVSSIFYTQTNNSGQHYVLIGPGTSGPILKRDKSVFTDNGTTFPWFATFGSIVLAHPNEIAMIQSIVVDSVQTGSHPWVTVWFDEINSSGVNYTYTDYVYDPYTAFESTTTYADRFYVSDQPDSVAICRHLQLAINFPAEDAGNTVLSSTIIGATEYDN